MLMNFSPLGLMNKPTYQTLDEVEIAKQIESIRSIEHLCTDSLCHNRSNSNHSNLCNSHSKTQYRCTVVLYRRKSA